jgi:putative ABC transport system substrate-binding protein
VRPGHDDGRECYLGDRADRVVIDRVMVMHRRDFMSLLGSLACALPTDSRAQKSDGVRRVGVIMPLAAADPQGRERDAAFRKALAERGWIEGRNVRFDFRWTGGDPELLRKYASELVALAPDAIMAGGGPVVGALQRTTRTVPIVFTMAIDPVARGYVASLSRPGGNITGFVNIEYEFSAKWLELLTEIAPNVKRAAILRGPGTIGLSQYAAIESQAASLHVEVSPIEIQEHDELARAIEKFAKEPDGGLVVTASTAATLQHGLIIGLAARYRLPAVYPNRFHVISGGLVSYGPIFLDQYRQAADYIDRILKGAKPADLPVQAPTRYEIVLNLGTAKALGLEVPTIVLARAEVVID